MYTYVAIHQPSGSWYYGVRTKSGAKPEDLGSTYFTSSKRIHELISEHGSQSISYHVRRRFPDSASAIAWEHRVLRRILNKPKCLNESAFPAVSETARARGNATKRKVGADGLTGFQRATNVWLAKRHQVNPDTGHTFEEDRKIKSQKTRDSAAPEVKLRRKEACKQQADVMNTPEVRARAHASLRKRVADGTFPTTKGRKFPSISAKLKGKQFTLGLVWANDGVKSVRLSPEDPILPTLTLGRLISRGSASRGYEHPKVNCPHCGKGGAGGNMKRYHFDNCKLK